MRAQSAIEAMLIITAFILVMGIFTQLYLNFSAKETSLSTRSRMEIDLHRIANAINDVYVLGPKNAISLSLSDTSIISAQDTFLTLSLGEQSVNTTLFTSVDIRSVGQHLIIENIGGKVVISAE